MDLILVVDEYDNDDVKKKQFITAQFSVLVMAAEQRVRGRVVGLKFYAQ
jgi:hypothetical protein